MLDDDTGRMGGSDGIVSSAMMTATAVAVAAATAASTGSKEEGHILGKRKSFESSHTGLRQYSDSLNDSVLHGVWMSWRREWEPCGKKNLGENRINSRHALFFSY